MSTHLFGHVLAIKHLCCGQWQAHAHPFLAGLLGRQLVENHVPWQLQPICLAHSKAIQTIRVWRVGLGRGLGVRSSID